MARVRYGDDLLPGTGIRVPFMKPGMAAQPIPPKIDADFGFTGEQ
jgi:hypothetical protein